MIPRIIHQTWKTAELPADFAFFRETWIRHHPAWEYRFWTDADNHAFLATHYPDFLPIYEAYRKPICRVDAVRYFLLKHYGGLYADLDFECLAPLDALLGDRDILLGLEPATHAARHRQDAIVCNALMASKPGHPFWDHVIRLLVAHRQADDPLEATGPFLLSRALLDFRDGQASIEPVPASLIYPADSDDCHAGRLFDLATWHERTREAVAMHHWRGTWYRQAEDPPGFPSEEVRLQVVDRGDIQAEMTLRPRTLPEGTRTGPLVSCLMVTADRVAQARLAIGSFQAQTYPFRELIVVDDGRDDSLAGVIAALNDDRIRHLRLPAEGRPLGALRNHAVALATGRYVCQWDDDDLYDPARLATQMAALRATGSVACLLGRWLIWWPAEERLAESPARFWEGSLLCEKSALPPYPELRRGEDTPVVETLTAEARVVLVDQARLYLYIVHGSNTFGTTHFEAIWQGGALRLAGEDYARGFQELSKRLDLPGYLRAIGARPEPAAAGPPPTRAPSPPVAAENLPIGPGRRRSHPRDLPTILILTPIKDAARFLPRYFDLACRLDYPRGKLSLAFLEGDSGDDTYAALRRETSRHRRHFGHIELFQWHHGAVFQGERWETGIQYRRRSAISACRNRLFRLAHRHESRVLWIDADVIDYPADIVLRLLETRHRIVVPHCVLEPGGPTFDLNSFRFKPGAGVHAWNHLHDGLIQPPRGEGRLYLDGFRGQSEVELDGVGGTMLLTEAALHADGILFPEYSYRGFIDTEGFAAMARDRGIRGWGLPDLEILHARE